VKRLETDKVLKIISIDNKGDVALTSITYELGYPVHVVCFPCTRAVRTVTFFFLENRAVDEVLWKSRVKPDRPQMAT
jgi:hypothetical protein